jgi:hypothetical protein
MTEMLGSISVQMAFACENFSTDQMGRVSFLSVMDNLAGVTFPATTPQMICVFGLMNSVPGFITNVKIAVEDKSGVVLREQAIADIAFKPDAPIVRVIGAVPGMAWPQPGTYFVKLYGNGKTLAWFPITISAIPMPEAPK